MKTPEKQIVVSAEDLEMVAAHPEAVVSVIWNEETITVTADMERKIH